MYKNIKEAETAYKNGVIAIQDLDSLEVYFQAVIEPNENTYCVDNWYYDEDDNYDLVVVHEPIPVTRRDLFRNYSLKDLTDPFCDVIDCKGHCLTKEDLQEIFWNMGN